MPLEEQVVSLGFGPGLSTKTDPKILSGKLTLLKNGIFTDARQIRKRNGYDEMSLNIVGGGTLSSPTMVQDYRNELVCAATGSNGQRLFSYSPTLNAWADKGKYLSVKVSKQEIAQFDQTSAPSIGGIGGPINATCAINSGFALYAYNNAGNTASYLSIVEIETGSQILNNYSLGLCSSAKAVLLGSSQLAVIYSADSTEYLTLVTVTITQSGGIVFGSPVTLESSVACLIYDVYTTVGGAAIVYLNGTSLDLLTIDTTGSKVDTATISSAGSDISVLHLNVDSSGQIWVYWGSGSPGSVQLMYAVYSSTLSSILTKTNIGGSTISVLGCISALSNSSTEQTVYYSTSSSITAGSSQPTASTINQVVVTTSIPGSATVFILNADIYSRPITIGSRNYMAVIFSSTATSTGVLIDLGDATPVAKFLPDESEYLFLVINNGSIPGRRSGFTLNSILPLSATQYILCTQNIVTLTTVANTDSTGLIEQPIEAVLGIVSTTFDFDNIDAYQSLIQQDTLMLNGGIVSQYDSAQTAELGFTVDPEAWISVPTASGSGTGGQWIYYATYEWLDALGNLHQSAPSPGYLAVFETAPTSFEIGVPSLQLTQKQNVQIVLWKTASAGQIAYRLMTNPNSSSENTVTFTDTFDVSDTTLATFPTLYTEGGAILENIAPPSTMIMWTNNNRAWIVDSENPETNIEYSKTASAGSGISFSTGQLELVIDSYGGAIRGASRMDEKTVILKQTAVGFFYGDGANDSGFGSTISNFQFVPSDTGCSSSKSVVLYPGGVLFQSPKGIYLLSRGLQVEYFGSDVEAYNNQVISQATITGKTSQIRFLSSNGTTLLYDYVFNQWSIFTNHQGYSADVWNGLYVYVRTGGSIYLENDSSYLDGTTPFQLSATTSWIKATQIQGFQRLRRIAMLGDYTGASGHGVQVSAFWDWSTTASSAVPYYFDGSSSVFQYLERLSQQKGDAVQLQIQEITTGASGEYIDFSDLGLEIMAKRGLNKLPPWQSVG